MPISLKSNLDQTFFERPAEVVAPRLLNKVFFSGEVSGRIVEVEAYGGHDDAASHAFKGRTARNEVMFGRPGLLYVYFTYGMHFCANVVCGNSGVASAVLIRALAPLSGVSQMRLRRGVEPIEQLCSGPAKLCQALSIEKSANGADLLAANSTIGLVDDGAPPPKNPGCGSRVGIRQAVEVPWRWWVANDKNLSKAKSAYLLGK